MQIQQAINNIFSQLSTTLELLSKEEYTIPCERLFGATIGQHVRHIIELFQCLENGYDNNIVNYENRKRDQIIETDKAFACSLLPSIYTNLQKPNKDLLLETSYDLSTESISISTNFFREIAYNLEHTIHHMALIRVGINEVSNIEIPNEFGVATATIKYRQQCVQ